MRCCRAYPDRCREAAHVLTKSVTARGIINMTALAVRRGAGMRRSRKLAAVFLKPIGISALRPARNFCARSPGCATIQAILKARQTSNV